MVQKSGKLTVVTTTCAPVDMVELSHYLWRVLYIQPVVVWDFWHKKQPKLQYITIKIKLIGRTTIYFMRLVERLWNCLPESIYIQHVRMELSSI